jgi:hypothetical protein
MTDSEKCTEVGRITPAQVVKCREESNTERWHAATMVAEDGSEVAYECCGGGGKATRFSLLRKGFAPRAVAQAEVPLSWVQRSMV